MTRAERAHHAARRYAREAVAVRDPLAIANTSRELNTAAARLAGQRARSTARRAA